MRLVSFFGCWWEFLSYEHGWVLVASYFGVSVLVGRLTTTSTPY